MPEVTYRTGGAELLERIDDMWQALNAHQAACSPDFSQAFQGRTIESRKKRWLASAANGLRITLAVADGRDVGYCLSFVGAKMDAVLESLWVDPSMRGKKIGYALTRDALDWFAAVGARTVDLEVTVGNDNSREFYVGLGFKPFKLGMRLKQ